MPCFRGSDAAISNADKNKSSDDLNEQYRDLVMSAIENTDLMEQR